MKVEILGSYGGESIDCRMTCLLLNDAIALDAGSLSQSLPIARQRLVHSIVLTHSHMDHTSSLPFFIENVFGKLREAVDIYASPATIYALRRHLFAVVARHTAIGQVDAVLESHAHQIAAQRQAQRDDAEHVAPRCRYAPDGARKQPLA